MRLKALEVQGFKTFPDKTKLDFTDGITAVVGPNGSGKSNISDAIRWVLGEQSAKALRCSKMEDVIFNGTRQRKKTGYAQVTLSFDNSDRALNFDGDEIAVTRRYYRSGNSEYLLNGAVVRLQDIHELFMDTGLGRDGYSMIGQGKIDSIVSSRSEDRREIFEEAAGISRFRYKKTEAERRLSRTEDDLVRLRDIIAELESRVGPLKIQSEKAKAYLEYAEEKRGLEIALWLRTLDRSARAVREQEDKLAVANKQYRDTEQELEDIEQKMQQLHESRRNAAVRSEQLRNQVSECETGASEKRSAAAVLRSDIKHNTETIKRITDEIKTLADSEVAVKSSIDEKKKEIAALEEKLGERRKEEARLTDELMKLRTGETESADRLAEINAELARLTASAGDARVGYMTAQASIREITERIDSAEDGIKAKRSQSETLREIIGEYEKMVSDCDSLTEKLLCKKQEIQQQQSEQQGQYSEIKSRLDDTVLRQRRLSDKARTLEELERNLEGFTHSVKLVMKEAARGGLSGIHGPVSRVIRVPGEYSTAIETALGAAMQNIVTNSDNDAKQAIRFLKQKDGGRATFLPMSTIKGRELSESGLDSCSGFVGIAAELCSCDDCYKGILMNLLGRIVVAENLDRAVEIAQRFGYRFRVVTLDGQVVNAGGSLTGGSLAKNAGLLGRTAEIEKLREQAALFGKQAEQLGAELSAAQENIDALAKQLTENDEQLADARGDKMKLEAEINSRRLELEAVKSSLTELENDRNSFEKKLSELNVSMEAARKSLDRYRGEISKSEETIRELSGSKDELVKKREKLAESMQDIRLQVLTVEKDIATLNDSMNNAEQTSRQLQERIRSGEQEILSVKKSSLETENEASQLEREAQELSSRTERLREQIAAVVAENLGFEKQETELRAQEKEKTGQRELLSGELARLEERRSGLQKEYDGIISKLWDEYEMTPREAAGSAAKIDEPGKAQRRLNELKQKIRGLGNVNVSAIEEYKEVSERYEFMSAQCGDVERSKSQLEKLIGELTKQMREIFIDRFRLINQNFAETFTELFGGGKASLSLTDPENVLTTGIEISVEPPGKIVSHIELLSGGEKALVAIALYFAIMKVSPAPFCVMDEIEAALDDVNVYRFAEYLRRMNDRTQFICITHRRGTMEEADVLYGVTMQERGISKLLELKAAEVEQKLGIKQ